MSHKHRIAALECYAATLPNREEQAESAALAELERGLLKMDLPDRLTWLGEQIADSELIDWRDYLTDWRDFLSFTFSPVDKTESNPPPRWVEILRSRGWGGWDGHGLPPELSQRKWGNEPQTQNQSA